MVPQKNGRPRRYDFVSRLMGGHGPGALAAAALDELSERVFDQIEDLGARELAFSADGSSLTIGNLVRHLAWAEASWMRRIAEVDMPRELDRMLQPLGADRLTSPEDSAGLPGPRASELIDLCRRVREQITLPALQRPDTLNRKIDADKGPCTAREVLAHLIWHWTYHSGHIGLLRQIGGSGFRWSFA